MIYGHVQTVQRKGYDEVQALQRCRDSQFEHADDCSEDLRHLQRLRRRKMPELQRQRSRVRKN
ncbi:MAG: hypothetical protein ACREA0_28130 [bacterium]